jgi:hypothetical protein
MKILEVDRSESAKMPYRKFIFGMQFANDTRNVNDYKRNNVKKFAFEGKKKKLNRHSLFMLLLPFIP